jgi:hypothetical protein
VAGYRPEMGIDWCSLCRCVVSPQALLYWTTNAYRVVTN